MRRPFSLSLTQAYLLSFALLAMWAVFAYITMHNLIKAEEKYAELINISGKQRMLSQRTALLAIRFVSSQEEPIKHELQELKEKMVEDHAYLLAKLPSPVLARVYRNDPHWIDERTREYFQLLERFLDNTDSASADEIFEKSTQLWPELDYAVQQYEHESTLKTAQLMRVESYILIGTLLTLLLEALLILRPTLRRANWNTRELQKRVHEKTEQLSVYQKIFANSNDGIMLTDSDNKIVEVNPAFTRITGYDAEEVVGKTPVLLKSTHLSHDFYDSFWAELYNRDYWSGEFINRKKDGSVYYQFTFAFVLRDEQGKVVNHIAIISDISATKADREKLEYLALYDMLTGLPNRSYLHSQIASAIERSKRYREKFAVILVDLDNFKWINDTLTHRVGDIVLKKVAENLKNCIRNMDTVSRIGGDEFVLLIEKVHLENSLLLLLEKIQDQMNQPLQIEEHQIHTTCSMGVAIYPDDATTQEELMKVADTAMYSAKHEGKNQFSFFTRELNLAVQEQAKIEHALQQALENDEFYLRFLPVYQLQENAIWGYEALLRWKSEALGLVAPGKFLPACEAMGRIHTIDFWMLRHIRELLEVGQPGEWPVFVNVSVKSIAYKDFVTTVREIFADSGVATRVIFDIAEEAFVEEMQTLETVITELAADGFRFAIDNFGSGYAAIRSLQQLPVEYVKIDRKIIKEVESCGDSCAFVEAIIAMCAKMSIEVIAEGIENSGQLSYLRRLEGCQHGEGYYFTEPLPPESLGKEV